MLWLRVKGVWGVGDEKNEKKGKEVKKGHKLTVLHACIVIMYIEECCWPMLGLVKGQINNVSSRDLGAGLKGGMYCTCTYDRFRERGGREIGWQWNWGREWTSKICR